MFRGRGNKPGTSLEFKPDQNGHCSVAIALAGAMLRHTYGSDASAIRCIRQQIRAIRDDPVEPGPEGRPGGGRSFAKTMQNLLAAPLCIHPATRAFDS